MARNFGVTVDDKRFDEFIDSAAKLERLQLRVGILSGKPKYPAGWVGTKSRVKDTMDRFADLSANASNPDRERSMLGAYRAKKKKTPGYGRRARKKRVAVAKVAAVVGFSAGKGERPKLPGLWIDATEKHAEVLQSSAAVAMKYALKGNTSGTKASIVRFGETLSMAFKAAVIREGHVDTRLLLNTINWEITDIVREKFLQRQVAAQNKVKRMLAKAKREAKAKARAAK